MQDEAVTSRCHDMVQASLCHCLKGVNSFYACTFVPVTAIIDWQQIILKYLGVKLAIVSPVKEIQQIQL